MKTYYDLLQIPIEATTGDIKKAYFKGLRKFSPEKKPEEFIEISKAYETLSNEEIRKEYDSFILLSGPAQKSYRLATDALDEENYKEAISVLEHSLERNPNTLILRSLLGEAYSRNNNTGKATTIFGELVKLAPNVPAFFGQYGKACLERGWHLKAFDAFRKAIELDPDHIFYWLGLSGAQLEADELEDARETLYKALEHDAAKDWGEHHLFLKAIPLDILLWDFGAFEEDLESLIEACKDSPESSEEAALQMAILSTPFYLNGFEKAAVRLIEEACRLAPDNTFVKATFEGFEEELPLVKDFKALDDDPFSEKPNGDLLKSYLVPGRLLDAEEDKAVFNTFAELKILEEFNSFKNDLLYLKANYPLLYRSKEDFFERLFKPNQKELMVKERMQNRKVMSAIAEEMGCSVSDLDFTPAMEPIVAGPKIGRNDLCPCGSGKKYKRCCGR